MPEARLPLTFDIASRAADTSKDSKIVNAIVEGEDIVKRSGLIALTLSGATVSSGIGQGIFSWNGYLVIAIAGHIYLITGETSVVEATGSPFSGMSTTVPLSFVQTINDNWLVFHDGSNIYAINKVNNTVISPLGGTGVISATITNQGGYYTTVPNVVFSGGSPATGTAVLYNNQVSSITITSAGTYTAGTIPTVTIDAPPAGTQATCHGTGGGLAGHPENVQIVSVTIDNGGGGYLDTSLPSVTFPTSYYNDPAVGYAIVNSSGVVTGVTVTHQGKYYATYDFPGGSLLNIPVTLSAPPTTTATAVANMNNTISGPFVPGIVYMDGSCYVMTSGIAVPKISTVTISNASPGVITWNSHGLPAGTQILFTTTGALPTGLTVGTIYYVLTAGLGTNSFEVSTQVEGTAINTSSAGSGTHTATATLQAPSVIYGSGINDPTTWNALNYIQASSDPDLMVGIARHLNYIVAFGTSGIEFFYDAGLPTPGSALATNRSAYLELGCANGYSIQNAEQTLIWVSTSITEGRSVYLLDGLSPVKISNRYVEKYLNKADMISAGGTNVSSSCFKISGHTLYTVTMKDLNLTLVYDLDEKKWYQWTSQSGDTGTVNSGTETYFTPISFSGYTEYSPGLYFLDSVSGKVYKMSPDYYDDNGNLIYFRAVSPRLDSGTKKRKFYKRVEAIGDSSNGTLYVRKFDDDYATPSTYRAMDLSVERPVLRQYGSSRRRAWEVFSSDSIPIRLKSLEIEFDVGEEEQG